MNKASYRRALRHEARARIHLKRQRQMEQELRDAERVRGIRPFLASGGGYSASEP